MESEPEKGTIFHIYLHDSFKEVNSVSETSYAGKGNILVMDDEALIRELLCEVSNQLGYRTDLAKDGGEAIEMQGIRTNHLTLL